MTTDGYDDDDADLGPPPPPPPPASEPTEMADLKIVFGKWMSVRARVAGKPALVDRRLRLILVFAAAIVGVGALMVLSIFGHLTIGVVACLLALGTAAVVALA